jgi:hypothetical protein
MARRLGSPQARRTGRWRKNAQRQRCKELGLTGATKPGLLPSMRNPSTCRVLRRAWTAGRLAGSLRFPPWPRILPTGSSLSIRNPAPPSEPPSERDQFHLIRLRSGQPPRPNVRPGPIRVDFPWAAIALIRNVRMAPHCTQAQPVVASNDDPRNALVIPWQLLRRRQLALRRWCVGFGGRPARSNACCSVSAGTAPIRKSKTRSNRPRAA